MKNGDKIPEKFATIIKNVQLCIKEQAVGVVYGLEIDIRFFVPDKEFGGVRGKAIGIWSDSPYETHP